MDHGRANRPLSNINDFELNDFLMDPNFDQFINFIRCDQTAVVENPFPVFDLLDLDNSNCFIDQTTTTTTKFVAPPTHAVTEDFFVKDDYLPDLDYSNNVADSLPSFIDGDHQSLMRACEYEDNCNEGEDDEYSASTTNTNTERKMKPDRSRTLVSERRRRGRMKEKLYALRSLVPNITKMDKASIVGDAVLYVQELQVQAKKLKAEIDSLEASVRCSQRYKEGTIPLKIQTSCSDNLSLCKKIYKMDVVQVEERGYYVRLVCNKGKGVAPSLYKFLESLTSFHVQNSNLTIAADKYLLTFTLDGTNFQQSLNLSNLKQWITASLLNQGFEFFAPLTS